MSFLKNIQNSTTSVVIPVLAAPTSQIATIVTQHYGSSIKVRGALMALGIGCGVVSIALVPISVAVMTVAAPFFALGYFMQGNKECSCLWLKRWAFAIASAMVLAAIAFGISRMNLALMFLCLSLIWSIGFLTHLAASCYLEHHIYPVSLKQPPS